MGQFFYEDGWVVYIAGSRDQVAGRQQRDYLEHIFEHMFGHFFLSMQMPAPNTKKVMIAGRLTIPVKYAMPAVKKAAIPNQTMKKPGNISSKERRATPKLIHCQGVMFMQNEKIVSINS